MFLYLRKSTIQHGNVIKLLAPLWKVLPQSRNSGLYNKFRQLDKYCRGAQLPHRERYWTWASILNEEKANYMQKEERRESPHRLSDDAHRLHQQKCHFFSCFERRSTIQSTAISFYQKLPSPWPEQQAHLFERLPLP